MNLLLAFDPCFGVAPTWALILICAAAIFIETVYGAPVRRLLWRLPLRFALLIILGLLLLRPSEATADNQELTPTLAVVLDGSRSLRLPGLDGPDSPPRLEAARQLLRERLQSLLIAAPGRHETWVVNDTLRRLDTAPESLGDWPAADGGSALADSLDNILNGAAPDRPGARCDTVILITDGAVTRGRGWPEFLADAGPIPAPIHVFALGDPDRAPLRGFDLGRLTGPDRVKAGEAAQYSLTLAAPAAFDAEATLRLRWQLDGVELAVHERPAPRKGALLTDTLIVPCPEPGILRLRCSVEAPAGLPAIQPPETSRLIHVESARIRVLFWSMQLSRQTRRIEEHLARDRVLSVNVANDFHPTRPADVANALRSADVLVWEAPDLARLTPATLQLVESRLQAGMSLVLLSSPRLDLTRGGHLLTWLPTQAAAPWTHTDTQPIAPAELRSGPFWRNRPPTLPTLTGRLQQLETAHSPAGFDPVVTTAEGRPILLAGKPAPRTAVAVLLTPDWPAEPAAAADGPAVPPSPTAAWTLGPLIRHSVHWAAGLDDRAAEPRLRLTLTDDRPLPDQPVAGGVELQNVDPPTLDGTPLQLHWRPLPAAPVAATPAAPPPQAIPWRSANGRARFQLRFPEPGAYVVEARWQVGQRTLTDRAVVYVAGEELEATTPPDAAGLRQLAAQSGGIFFPAAGSDPADWIRLQEALRERLQPQPLLQVTRAPFTGLAPLSSIMLLLVLVEMFLRTRRLW